VGIYPAYPLRGYPASEGEGFKGFALEGAMQVPTIVEVARVIPQKPVEAKVQMSPMLHIGITEPKSLHRLTNLVGQSKRMVEVYKSVLKVSQSKATVLLRGESGTGKELIARAIHYGSPRAKQPFIKLNCAALPETLLESELFGHEKGAFTGATELRRGRFELADGGTLFLDEIGDIPPMIQVKLLRVLQETCFERLGGDKEIEVDVRLIAATHRDLEAAMREGSVREDLYYRLNVVPIFLPPLRDRKEDIPLLIEYFLDRFKKENRKNVVISPKLINLMMNYNWPGNVRELENCIERLVILAENETVAFDNIPETIRTYFKDMQAVTTPVVAKKPGSLSSRIETLEREQIIEALEKCGGVQVRAARLLGLTARQIAYKMAKYKIVLHPINL